MRARNYRVYDVFADRPLAGNPLAIVDDAEGLDDTLMQRIAREFNLSETVFILPPQQEHHTARVRIFTPRIELPFAGHPTVGSAIALAEGTGKIGGGKRSSIVVLEEEVGPVRCAVTAGEGVSFAEFDLPRIPEALSFAVAPEAVAAALGLDHHQIGFENHLISGWNAGVPFVCIPVANLEAAGRVKLNSGLWLEMAPRIGDVTASPYIYCRETVGHAHAFHARMLAPYDGIAEDPATGSAAAAFAGAIVRFDQPMDGSQVFLIEQGIEMGRPSSIRLEVDVQAQKIETARIGGHAVRVAEGTLYV